MTRREFVFEIKEIKNVYDSKMQDNKRAVVHITTGLVMTNGEEIEVLVDDNKQPHESFIAKDKFFTRLIRKIHEATK